MNLSPEIIKSLDKMRLDQLMPVQEEAIPLILDRQDVIIQAPTGSGKTCAFGIPAIEMLDLEQCVAQCLILCPTRELTIQISDVLHKLTSHKHNIRITPIYGGASISGQISALRRRPQIIVATPGRIMDHIRRKTVLLNHVKQVILDEADQMLDMGFRSDIDIIFKSLPRERQTILFSATLSKGIKQIAKEYQNNAKMVHIIQDTLTVNSVSQYYAKIPRGGKLDAIKLFLKEKQFNRCIVFVATKSMTDVVKKELSENGFIAEAIHGDLHQHQRNSVMNKYRKNLINILVATDVAARGIDVDDIEAVINFDIPNDTDSYVHRIGRTGRANKEGFSYTFIYSKEQFKLDSIVKDTKATISVMSINGVNCNESMKLPQKRRTRTFRNNSSKSSRRKKYKF